MTSLASSAPITIAGSPDALEIGAATLVSAGLSPVIAVIVPQVCSPVDIRVDLTRQHLVLQTRVGDAIVRGLPDMVLKALHDRGPRAFVFAVNTLTEVHAAWHTGVAVSRDARPQEVQQYFTTCLSGAIAESSIDLTKYRVLHRQPEIEAFVRKLAQTLERSAPDCRLSLQSQTTAPRVKDRSGPHNVAEFAMRWMDEAPRLAPIADGIRKGDLGLMSADFTPSSHEFAILHSVAYATLAAGGRKRELLINGAASLGASLLSLDVPKLEGVLGGADSVFLQSYCDCYATFLMARVASRDNVLAMLRLVEERRKNSGDFTMNSNAPMSHDTRSAIATAEALLLAIPPRGSFSHEDLARKALMVAMESVDTWLQDKDLPGHLTRKIGTGIQEAFALIP